MLTVTDDGRGIGDGVEGAGIRGMRERALLVGAELRRRAAPGGGTEVRLRVPTRDRGWRPWLTTRILLADDHALVRRGLRLILDGEPGLTVVAEAGDGPRPSSSRPRAASTWPSSTSRCRA